jgi:hypothetical protein
MAGHPAFMTQATHLLAFGRFTDTLVKVSSAARIVNALENDECQA